MARTAYRTKQKELLLSYLKETGGQHFTVEDVCAHFAKEDETIGVATVYRYLDKMVGEGSVAKYVIDEHSAACFEYRGESACMEAAPHFHLKCEKCGTLIHLQCDELSAVQTKLFEDHGFELNPMRTVFYGVCADCRKKTGTEE